MKPTVGQTLKIQFSCGKCDFPIMIVLFPMAKYSSLYYSLRLSDSLDEDGEIFNPLTISFVKELCLFK